ncbi:MAG: response regulator [Calditrichaeota bacterium]|nr:response regulator [Calditrichota bacterium]
MTPTKGWLDAFLNRTEDQLDLIDRESVTRPVSYRKKIANRPARDYHLRSRHYWPASKKRGKRRIRLPNRCRADQNELRDLLDVIHELLQKIKEARSSADVSQWVVAFIKKYFQPDLLEQIVIRERKIKILQPGLEDRPDARVQNVAWEDFFAPEFSLEGLFSKNILQFNLQHQDVDRFFSKKTIRRFRSQGVDIIRMLFSHIVQGSVIIGIIGWKTPLPKLVRNERFFELSFLTTHLLLGQILDSEIVENQNRSLSVLNKMAFKIIQGATEKEIVSLIADELLRVFPGLIRISYLTPDETGNYWIVQTAKMRPAVQAGLTYLKNMKLIPVREFNPERRVEIFENFNIGFSKLGPIHKDLYRSGIRSSAHIPVSIQNNLIGFLNLGFDRPLEIHLPIMRPQFEMMGTQMAIGIKQSRMLAEQEKFQKLWQHVLDSIPLGISVHDANWRVLQINRAIRDLLGLQESDIIGQKCFRLFHKIEHPIESCPFLKLLKSKQPERKVMDIFGDGRQFEVICYPLLDENQAITGTIHIVEDVTQKLAMQKEIFQREKLATLGEIIAGVAHELNNPLTGVLGFADLLLEESELPETVRRDLTVIKQEAERSRKIVRNLLTFARQTEFKKEPQDINFIIEKTIELVEYDLKRKGVTFVRNFGKNLPFIMADFFQLQQVFINLINNASQAILSQKQSGIITFTTRVVGTFVEIIVEDDGPGIPSEILPKIFDPFFTTKDVGKGTGLGLSVSFGIVHEHGGKIAVQSEPGKGAVFTLVFPYLEETVPVGDGLEKKPFHPAIKDKKILIVDDEEVILSLLRLIYGKTGNRIETAENGRKALEKLESDSFDLILADLRMPEMDGESFFAHLKKKSPELVSRIIFMTGDAISDETQRFFKKNRLPYLIKPFDMNDLKTLILNIFSENNP